MVQHRKTVHEGKKDFACGLCTFKVLIDLLNVINLSFSLLLLFYFQSSRKFNLNQHVERVHKGQQQLALSQMKTEAVPQIQQDPQQQQQQIIVPDQNPPLQIMQQQQPQHPLQIQLQQPQTLSLNPPTMVAGAGGLQSFKIEPATQQQPQQTVTASLVMQPPKPGQTGPPVFTLNFPTQPLPLQQQSQQPQQQQQQQQQVHVQQVHVQKVQPLAVTVKRKTPKQTHECK